MKQIIKTSILATTIMFSCIQNAFNQVQCSALASSGTGYKVIQDAGFGIETPDVAHSDLGNHITQVYDEQLKKNVFEFHSHIIDDNDPSTDKTDRVRIEIKGGPGASSNFLSHNTGDVTYYRWKFRIAPDFIGSDKFCHIFQLKAKNGDDSMPIITLTPRTKDFQLIHDGGDSGSDLGKVMNIPLALFLGKWVECFMKIKHGEEGAIEVTLKDFETGNLLLTYTNENIDLWREGASYNRPKWGIYRSKADGLKDEKMRFADWCISESAEAQCPSSIGVETSFANRIETKLSVSPNPANSMVSINGAFTDNTSISIYNIVGKQMMRIVPNANPVQLDVTNFEKGIYLLKVRDEKGSEIIKLIVK